mmetsp:Transcript_94011/g.298480  ORF Transcript_94011/g.298480 Transcript_94011/m.298480 type:complete len:125 (+) Transcript_94011:676-1050(+)
MLWAVQFWPSEQHVAPVQWRPPHCSQAEEQVPLGPGRPGANLGSVRTHCEYHSSLTTHSSPAPQQEAPIHFAPPHCCQSSAQVDIPVLLRDAASLAAEAADVKQIATTARMAPAQGRGRGRKGC